MSTLFTKIIDGELPGRFVWTDDTVVGFLSINPLGPGHTLVVPRVEVDHWVEADPALVAHLTGVSHAIGSAITKVWQPPRVGLIVAGFEVPHLHVHVFPAWDMAAFDFAGAAVRAVWAPPRVGLLVAGFEVPHLHVHVFPAADMRAFDFANAAATVDADEQDGYADALRAALRAAGHEASTSD